MAGPLQDAGAATLRTRHEALQRRTFVDHDGLDAQLVDVGALVVLGVRDRRLDHLLDQVRGLPAERAVNLLKFSDKKAAALIKKVVESAIANAENNQGADVDELKVKTIMVDEGPSLKRFMARAKGRGTRILKRTSHITVVVGEGK